MPGFLVPTVVGVTLILIASEILVSSAKHIAHSLRIPPLLISLFFVSLGTSLPELIVATTSIIKHDAGLGLGNVVGSNIINSTLLFGIAILVGRLRIGTQKTQRNSIVLSLVTVIFVVLQYLHVLTGIQTLFLLGLAFAVGSYHYELGKHMQEQAVKPPRHHPGAVHQGLLFLMAVVGMSFGGVLYVSGLESFATYAGISTTIVGLLISSFATTTPELLTTVVAMKKGESKIAIGNLLGSNIYNLALIGGLLSLEGERQALRGIPIFFLLLASGFFVYVVRTQKGKVIPKYIGICALSLFALFFLVTARYTF